ncbi:methyltransferase [Chloropicon primus]|uniref:Methyltransferase n=1 Tax=Chloropicon primus TaxID=1764295 RepID=A0A5B8MUP5_9CHLO|nr:methyltransferase [Chloropicon primus]|eukprot:QDZ24293.1 methyltransferase [Chloropicon primus]
MALVARSRCAWSAIGREGREAVPARANRPKLISNTNINFNINSVSMMTTMTTTKKKKKKKKELTTTRAGPVRAGRGREDGGLEGVELNRDGNQASRRSSVLFGGTGLLLQCCGNPACAARSTEGRVRSRRGYLAQRYDKFQAVNLSEGMVGYEKSIALMKRRLFGGLAGSPRENLSIVELGIGSGPNLQYYAPGRAGKGDTITGIDTNCEMFGYARDRIAKLESAPDVNLVVADAGATGLPDSSADAVIATLLLCSVEDQDATLAEIRRILKPGGKYYFVEHVGAQPGTPLRIAQDVLTPLQRVLAGGCNLNKDTSSAIARAFADGEVTQYRYDVLPGRVVFSNGFELENPEGSGGVGSLISPHISGEATAGECILKRCPPRVTL